MRLVRFLHLGGALQRKLAHEYHFSRQHRDFGSGDHVLGKVDFGLGSTAHLSLHLELGRDGDITPRVGIQHVDLVFLEIVRRQYESLPRVEQSRKMDVGHAHG